MALITIEVHARDDIERMMRANVTGTAARPMRLEASDAMMKAESRRAPSAPLAWAAASAVGSALAHQVTGRQAIAVAFFGDGAMAEGALHESMNLASVWDLTAVFVFENNGYAESTAASWSVSSGDIVKRAEAARGSG